MRYQAVGAVFDAVGGISEIPTAAFTECVQRAVTKQAVKLFYTLMARVIFTVPVREEFF